MHYKDEMEKLGDDSIPTYHRLNMIRAVLDRQDSLMLFDWECHQDEPADT
jgi:nicotinic acid mononucleotide adenylyltransferase